MLEVSTTRLEDYIFEIEDDKIKVTSVKDEIFEPLIDIDIPPHFNYKTEFYYYLIRNEGTRLMNNLNKAVQVCNNENEAKFLINTTLIKVQTFIKDTATHLKELSYTDNLRFDELPKNKREAEIIVNTVYSIDSHLKIFAPYGSEMAKAASSKGMAVMFESFADRSYDSDGFLVSRSIDGSVISDPKNVLTQVSNILNGHLKSMDGNMIPIHSDTICVHGDHATVVESLILIRKTFGQKTNA